MLQKDKDKVLKENEIGNALEEVLRESLPVRLPAPLARQAGVRTQTGI